MLELLLLGQAHVRVFRVRTQLPTCNPHMIQHHGTILGSNVLTITCCCRFQETDNHWFEVKVKMHNEWGSKQTAMIQNFFGQKLSADSQLFKNLNVVGK
jgi:hypothetical protein